MIWGTAQLNENGERDGSFSIPWPVHEVGRNADIFDEDASHTCMLLVSACVLRQFGATR